MFKAKDKNDQQIYLRDTVKYEAVIDDMGMLGAEEGTVLTIPAETQVQVQSLNGGPPVIMDACDVEVTYSLVADIANLSSNEQLQEMVLKAELRYTAAVTASKTKRGGGRGKATPKEKKGPAVNALDLLMAAKKPEAKPAAPVVKKQGVTYTKPEEDML
jgi:hypothetical protein